MITDLRAYERLCERERWEELRRMSPQQSIAVGEALLRSELMRLSVFPAGEEPLGLAISLRRAAAARGRIGGAG